MEQNLPKSILVLDTETVDLAKCFCYDIGYVVAMLNDYGTYDIVKAKHFLISEVWNNKPLFETSYYACKKEYYNELIADKKITIHTLRYVLNYMLNDIEFYHIDHYCAYNSKFDTKVFKFNADFMELSNPLADLQEHDIQAVAKIIHNSEAYQRYCADNGYITDKGFTKVNAEITYRYLTGEEEFDEKHTGLDDVKIELYILNQCLASGGNFFEEGQAFIKDKYLPKQEIIVIKNGDTTETHEINYTQKKIYKNKTTYIM